ncbi:MAG: VWA domain-containing protein [Bacteroidales bacterium]|nr:VWA domain-containing protein [Bacteroidales bacterium]
MIQFAHKEILWVLLATGLMILGYILFWQHRKRALRRMGDQDLLRELMPDTSVWAQHWKFILLFTGTVLLIIAASGPRIGSRLQEVEHKGREVIIALDVSNSMLAEDVLPSRLERSKQMINRMVDRMSNDKIGLIVFAGEAYTQIPITDDYPSVKMFLSGAGPDMVSKQGTAIGSAIYLAARSFSTEERELRTGEGVPNQAIVVITDGENHEDDAVGEAAQAAEKGIKVYTVGLGDPNGVPVPLSPGSKATRRDRDGNVVVSKLNESLLKEVAQEGRGAYIPGDRINNLIDELDKLERAELKTRVFAEFAERFQYFAGFALLFLVLEFFLRSRRSWLLLRLNLFKTDEK